MFSVAMRLLPLILFSGVITSVCAADQLIVTEIAYNPRDPDAEYVEVFNPTGTAISAHDLFLSDSRGTAARCPGTEIASGTYAVLARDPAAVEVAFGFTGAIRCSPWPSLNNDGDAVVVRTGSSLADSLTYHPSWGGEKCSLERIHYGASSTAFINWTTSRDPLCGTPGRANSVRYDDTLPPAERGDVLFNEILYEPRTTADATGPAQPEYVELTGRVSGAVNLAGTRLIVGKPAGEPDTCYLSLAPEPLASGMYIVLTRSGALEGLTAAFGPEAGTSAIEVRVCTLALLNDGGTLEFQDRNGQRIDHVAFGPAFHNPFIARTRGISLERIDPSASTGPEAWTSSIHPQGGTPGAQNSVYCPTSSDGLPAAPATGLTITPSPFSPDRDGQTHCQWRLKYLPDAVRVRIFDVDGHMIRELIPAGLSGIAGTAAWDGTNDHGERVRSGPYIVVLEAAGRDGPAEKYRKVVVAATNR